MTEEWTAPAVDRPRPDFVAGERTGLEQWLDYHRATLLTKCAGLTAAQLKTRGVPPSELSLLGLVRHLTEVEQWWFRMVAAGEHDLALPYDPEQNGADFREITDSDPAANLRAYQAEIEAARAAVADQDLDSVVGGPPGHDPERRFDLRWIYLHMIEEYARHNGHADLLREVVDGVTGY